MIKRFLVLVFAATIVSCTGQSPEPKLKRADLQKAKIILNDALLTEILLQPDAASRVGMSGFDLNQKEARLHDASLAGFERARLIRLDLLKQLRQAPNLPPDHPVARDLDLLDIAYSRLRIAQEIGQGRQSLYDVTPFPADAYGGVWIEGLQLLDAIHRVTSFADAQNYNLRVNALADAVDDTRRRFQADALTGSVPPKNVLRNLKAQIDLLLSDQSETLDNIVVDLESLVLSVSDSDAEERNQLVSQATYLVNTKLRPAYFNLSTTLGTLIDAAPGQPGRWMQPIAPDQYSLLLTWHLGRDRPDTEFLHSQNMEVTEERLAAFENAMFNFGWDQLAQVDRFAFLRQQYDLRPDTRIFSPVPIITRTSLPEAKLALTGTEYLPAALDQSRPEIIFVNPVQLDLWPVWIRDLLTSNSFHAPEIAMSEYTFMAAEHTQLRYLVNFSDLHHGWISDQQSQAVLETPPASWAALAWRHWLLIEAALASADTGINFDQWTEAYAVDFLIGKVGLSQQLATEAIAYITAYPGQYSARIDGARQINSLRISSRSKLSSAYDEDDFRQRIVSGGNRPIEIVNQDITRWHEGLLDARSGQP